MMKWLKLLEDEHGYPFDFISPHPIQTCEQILNDHSQSKYLTNNPIAFLNERKQHAFPFIDVHHLTFDVYKFRMECAFGWTNHRSHKIEINGTFTRHVDGTQITGFAKFNTRAKIGWWAWIAGLCFSLWVMIGSFLSPTANPSPILLFYQTQLLFLGWLFWRLRIRPTIRFIKLPEKWLRNNPISIAQAKRQHNKSSSKTPFDVYAPMSMAVCMEHLRKGWINEHYQHTQAGMKFGTDIDGDLFITFEEESPEKSYFLLERSMWLSGWIPYNTPTCAIGSLQAEEDMIHIQGYAYLPNRHIYPFIIGLGIIVIILAVWLSSWMLLIFTIGYSLIRYQIHRLVRPFQRYPEQAIFKQVQTPNHRNWLGLRHEFDFYSPYPLADCINMLLDYSIVGDYENEAGIHKSAYVNKCLVTVTESPDGKFSFSVKSINNQGNSQAEAIGKLESVGYSTQVSGTSTTKLDWMLITFILIGCAVLISISLLGLWLFIFFSMLAYAELRRHIFLVGNYPQHILGGKGGRKTKKDRADE